MRGKSIHINCLWCLLFLQIAVCPAAFGKTIYVDDDATGANDGSSWENAYVYLQDALADANSVEKHALNLSNGPVEIRVAQGIYKPSLFTPKPEQEPEQEQESVGRRRGETPDESGDEPDDKSESFHLINGVTLKGGFAGLSEPDPNHRDIELYKTILSGDLNDDDVPEDLIFDNIDRFLQSYSDNSECIIKGNSIDRTSVLDGFVITGGYLFQWAINGRGGTSPTDSGGGMLNVSSSPTVINCNFERNRYAVYNHTGSSPVFTCCRFAYNFASGGGAIQNIDSNPEVSDCIFENNGAWVGGAICLRGECNAILSDCTFLANQARQSGGAIYNDGGDITVTNCDFDSNRVAESVINGPGGAVFSCGDSTTVFEECSFIQNETPAHGGGIYASNGILTLFNCKFYSNYAYSMGGGLVIGEGVLSSIDNCTFESNIADLGSAIYNRADNLNLDRCILVGNRSLNTGSAVRGARRGGLELIQCTLDGNVDRHGTSIIDFDSYIVRNSIIWDQRAFHVDDRSNTNISYSDIRNSWLDQSQGNIDEDPLFANPGYWADVNDPNIIAETNDPNAVWVDGDYHLKSQAGRYDSASESWPCTILGTGWVIDDVTSPCIDAGDPNNPIGDEPFPNGGIINMGAYGGTSEASKSYILTKTIYVDDDAPVSSVEDRNGGLNDGSSWQDAYRFLQDALVDANDSEKPVEIRVAQGTYRPNQGLLPIEPGGINTRTMEPYPPTYPADLGIRASFNLINDVTIKGGYAGLNEPDPNFRDIELYETILSGDHNGDDIKIEEGLNGSYSLIDEPNRSDNNMHVVTSTDNYATSIIDGFTITGGWDMSITFGGRTGGAGMRINSGNPTIKNCIFTSNAALQFGGGIFNISSNPTLINCKFIGNYAGNGGGMCNGYMSPFTLSHGSNPTLIKCTFNNNYAYFSGGGIYNMDSNPKLNNCTFSLNTSILFGGGMYNNDGSNPILSNCTISDNFANDGAAIFGGSPKLRNCIVWNNTSPQIINNASISFSDIQGGWEGEGNIDVEPLFANPGYWADVNDPNIVAEPDDPNAVWIEGDYHLKSQAGRYDPASGSWPCTESGTGWVIDDVTSPCIDAGDPNSPVAFEPFPNGGIINMGAYGGTVEASKSYFGEPPCETIITGDINGDCKVDLKDFMLLANHWLKDK